MAVIYITEADSTQHKFRLPEDPNMVITIGRRDDCLISLPMIVGLSGMHCSISMADGQYVITDEGSSNGTLDGDRAISSEYLRAGVAYSIGSAVLIFDPEVEAVPAAAPAPSAPPAPKPKAKKKAPASSALAEAAASLSTGKPRKHAPSALAEAAASIGAKDPAPAPMPVAEPAPAPVAEPAPAPAPEEQPMQAEAPASEYSAPAPAPAAPAVEPPPAPRKKKKRKMPLNVPKLKKSSDLLSLASLIYVIIVLAISFYGGMTLRHWMETGTYMPDFDFSAEDGKK